LQKNYNSYFNNIRVRAVILFTLIIAILLCVRLIYLAALDPEDYIFFEENKHFFKRGDIYDRNGVLLAVSDELYSVYANPKEIKSVEEAGIKLSPILNMPQDKIIEKIKTNKSFIWIKRQVSPKQSQMIKDLKLNGISLQAEYKRLYPGKRLASHILGFCDIDNNGQEGIEKSLNSSLISYKKLGSYDYSKMESGNNVYLTIDAFIQAVAENTIKEAVIKENADYGSLILMNGKTGEVLSMANFPDFDPNSYNEFQQKDFRNYSIFYLFEPGSVFKVFNIAALLDKGVLDKSDFFYCDGLYKDNYVSIKCTGVHGSINYYDILKYSCNESMIQAGLAIKDIDYYKYLKAFGFGEPTGIVLSGEQSGLLRRLEDWTPDVSARFISIGQEISVSALQIVRAATSFVNDGILLEPLIVGRIINQDNQIIKEYKRKEIARVYKSGIAENIIAGMKTSGEPGGTVARLKIGGMTFAAKSGTAQIYDVSRKMYRDDEVTSSLLVIFPSEDPLYIAFIVFHKPRNQIKWGGIIGAYALNDFFKNLNTYLFVDNLKTFEIKRSDLKVTREYKKVENLPVKMPDLKGLTSGDVLEIFSKVNVKIEIDGRGTIYKHKPETGEVLSSGSVLKLYLKE